jgi:hypothetical protein
MEMPMFKPINKSSSMVGMGKIIMAMIETINSVKTTSLRRVRDSRKEACD